MQIGQNFFGISHHNCMIIWSNLAETLHMMLKSDNKPRAKCRDNYAFSAKSEHWRNFHKWYSPSPHLGIRTSMCQMAIWILQKDSHHLAGLLTATATQESVTCINVLTAHDIKILHHWQLCGEHLWRSIMSKVFWDQFCYFRALIDSPHCMAVTIFTFERLA